MTGPPVGHQLHNFSLGISGQMEAAAQRAAGLTAAALVQGAVQCETAAALCELCGRSALVVRYATRTPSSKITMRCKPQCMVDRVVVGSIMFPECRRTPYASSVHGPIGAIYGAFHRGSTVFRAASYMLQANVLVLPWPPVPAAHISRISWVPCSSSIVKLLCTQCL